MRLVIMRGLPGSGKSTYARLAINAHKSLGFDNSIVLSTDDYFIDENGIYRFNGSHIARAHEWNFNRVQRCIDLKYHLIIVDNTHTQFWECIKVIELGLSNGFEVQFTEPNTPWALNIEELLLHNTHKVPRDAIQKMIDRWEPTDKILDSLEEKYRGTLIIDREHKLVKKV